MSDQFIESAFKDVMAQLRALRRPTAWEYQFRVLSLSVLAGVDEGQKELDTAGADGWEVVTVIAKQSSLDHLALMKRPKK